MKLTKIKNGNNNQYKIPIKFSIDTLNMIIAYTISDSALITRANLVNVRKLFNILDIRIYKKDHYMLTRIYFIKKSVEARLDNYMENPKLILEYCRSKKYEDTESEVISDALSIKLNASEIKFLSSMISDKLTYSFLYVYKDPISDLIMRLQNGDYDSLKQLKKEFKTQLTGLLTEIRRVESVETTGAVFSLADEVFENSVANTMNLIKSPSSVLKTNIQALNEMLNGGFKAKRIYLFLGLSGGFKSGTMLNIAYNIKLANKNFKTKDPLKTPAILFVTLENSVEETIERLFSLSVSSSTDDTMDKYTTKEAIKLLRTKGSLKLTRENNIDIIIIYKSGGNVTAADLNGEIDNYQEQGYEIICLIADYVKKMRSIRDASELRLELTYIITELKSVAIERCIPVITPSQLNREAARTIDAAVTCNKTDLARMLGSANVGESYGMIEESDFVAIINKERIVSSDEIFLTFKRLKIRYGTDETIDYFNHPFAPNGMKLLFDTDQPQSLSRANLSDLIVGVPEDEDETNKKGRTNAMKRKVVTKDVTEVATLNTLEKIFG